MINNKIYINKLTLKKSLPTRNAKCTGTTFLNSKVRIKDKKEYLNISSKKRKNQPIKK